MRTFIIPRTMEEWADFWWVRVPTRVRNFSDPLAVLLTDGLYLCASARAAALAPFAALAGGMLLAYHPLWHSESFSSSLTVLVILVVLGNLSGALGAWLTGGYFLTDLCMPHPSFYNVYKWDKILFGITVHFALPIASILLVLLAAVIPFMSRRLMENVSLKSGLQDRPPASWTLQIQLAYQVILLYLWNQSFPVLIRPIWFWNHGASPETPDISPVQDYGWIMLITGTVMAFMRFAIDRRWTEHPSVERRRAALLNLPPLPARQGRRWPLWVRIPVKAILPVYFVSGMITKWWEAAALPCILGLVYWLREQGFPPGDGWSEALTRIPLGVRMAAGAALVYGATYFFIIYWMAEAQSFWPIMVGVVIGQVVFMLLIPSRARPRIPPKGPGAS